MSTSSNSHTALHAAIALIGTLAGVAATGYFALQEWMSPATPLAITGAGLLGLLALNTVVALILGTDEDSLGATLMPATLPTLLIGALGVAASAAWFSQDIRQRGLQEAAERGMRQGVVGALQDPAPPVVARACTRLFEVGIGGQRQRLLNLLDRRPNIARACLNRAAERLASAGPDSPAAGRLADISKVLGERWYERLMGDSPPARPQACALADHLGHLPEPARGETAIPGLLTCTIAAAGKEARTCCGEALQSTTGTGGAIVEAMGNSITHTIATRLGPALIQASLHQLQMEDAERARLVRLGLTKAPVRRWAIRFGCSYVLASDTNNELVYQFSAWLDDSDCPARADTVRGDLDAWKRICGQAVEQLDEGRPDDVLCRASRTDVTATAFRTASDRVHAAAEGALHSLLESKIAAGTFMQKSMSKSRRAAFRRMARRMEEDGLDSSNMDMYIRIQKLANGRRPPPGEVMKESAEQRSMEQMLEKLKSNPEVYEELEGENADRLDRMREQMESDEFKEKLEEAREQYKEARD